ncbi:MAG: cystathionine gamma-synthase family protein [Alphaproteobacteria bacterium]|nr:cystathionine gamma-synthase family protein [Alphaproteobacteria bacterium]
MNEGRKNYRKKMIGNHKLSPETQMMGYGYDPSLSEGSLKPPVFMTSTFVFESAKHGKDFFELAYGKRQAAEGEEPGLIYSRINNPDLEVLEDRLALWEDADKGLTFSSGMAAISTCLWAYLRPGDVIVYSAPIYGGTEFLIRNILPEFGIKAVEFEAGGEKPTLAPAIEEAKKLGRVAVIYTETPANPTNGLIDLHACRDQAEALGKETGHRPVIMTDNTFLGPVWQSPLEHGADIVIYSLTKYVGGHSDVVAGAAIGNMDVMGPVMGFRTILGTMCDPHTGWLLMRSLETLKLRMTAAAENAKKIAEYLDQHPKVKKVHYLGFLKEDHPSYHIFRDQCGGAAGSTFAFDVDGDEAAAFRVLDALQIIKLAVSLGGTESLMEHPFAMTHADVPDDVKVRLGITESMLRISVGVENPDDLIADLSQALDAI